MKEHDVEQHLVDCVKHLGGEIRKTQWVGRNSAPDRLVALPGNRPGFPCLVELKRPGKLATFPADAHERAQAREHVRLRKVGFRVVVIDSILGVDKLLGLA